MARFEILDSDAAPLGEGPAAGDMLFELGLMYSVGRDVPVDLVSAHKWFNLAAMKGNNEAIRLRREIACQMADAEIATAQRAARDWLRGKAGTGGDRDRGLIGASDRALSRFVHPEPVHAGKRVGPFGFECVPAVEVSQGPPAIEPGHCRLLGETLGEAVKC